MTFVKVGALIPPPIPADPAKRLTSPLVNADDVAAGAHPVYRVKKDCVRCKRTFEALSFLPQYTDTEDTQPGLCETCFGTDEDRVRRREQEERDRSVHHRQADLERRAEDWVAEREARKTAAARRAGAAKREPVKGFTHD